jgi:hypothetical protein
VERIDRAHANAKRLWRESGGPDYLSVPEVEYIREASRIVQEPQHCELANGTLRLDIALPPQAVAAITIDLAAD